MAIITIQVDDNIKTAFEEASLKTQQELSSIIHFFLDKIYTTKL
jgi:antitoxin component of RelBE/YafQ-DinJ toxin-antitoxin module